VAVLQMKVKEVVDYAVAHRWSIPEFQRGFVWRPPKVRDLAESLWMDYPVGSFLLWRSPVPAEPRTQRDAQEPDLWVVDGQQRTTALCLLFSRKPYWWSADDDWNEALKRFDVRFNPFQETEPFFLLASAPVQRATETDWIPVHKILNSDDEQLAQLVEILRVRHDLAPHKFHSIWTRLDAVRKVREKDIVVITVDHEVEDVVEIFTRLNNRGTKVTEADVFLALASSKNPGWTREDFLPFIKDLKDAGFGLDPNLVFRTLIAIGAGKTRFKEVASEFWATGNVKPVWRRCQEAWQEVVHRMQSVGILNSDILPTHNALLPLIVLKDRFKDKFQFGPPFACFLGVSYGGRYSGSAITTLGEDVRLIDGASTLEEALRGFDALTPDLVFKAEDFLADSRDEYFRRFLLYLIFFARQAHDWKEKTRLGFEGKDLLVGFSPDWHHIFPRRYLEENGVQDDKINALANMAVIDPKTNIRFGKKPPTHYLEKYEITDSLLEEQLVPTDRELLTVENFDRFLEMRSEALAEAANKYFSGLRRNVFGTV
jgi:hypothetical protein